MKTTRRTLLVPVIGVILMATSAALVGCGIGEAGNGPKSQKADAVVREAETHPLHASPDRSNTMMSLIRIDALQGKSGSTAKTRTHK